MGAERGGGLGAWCFTSVVSGCGCDGCGIWMYLVGLDLVELLLVFVFVLLVLSWFLSSGVSVGLKQNSDLTLIFIMLSRVLS